MVPSKSGQDVSELVYLTEFQGRPTREAYDLSFRAHVGSVGTMHARPRLLWLDRRRSKSNWSHGEWLLLDDVGG